MSYGAVPDDAPPADDDHMARGGARAPSRRWWLLAVPSAAALAVVAARATRAGRAGGASTAAHAAAFPAIRHGGVGVSAASVDDTFDSSADDTKNGQADDDQVLKNDANGSLTGVTGAFTKMTWAASDTESVLDWLLTYIPSSPADDSCTNSTCTCGSQGRVSMAGSGFGLHAVNTSRSHCTSQALTVAHVEAKFEEKLAKMDAFDSFLDFCVGFWAPNGLDKWARDLEAGGQRYLVLSWTADGFGDDRFYSLLMRVPRSQVVIELVSTSFNTSIVEHLGRAREGAFGTLAKAPLQRVSSHGLRTTAAAAADDRLTPLKVSRATTDAERDVDWYNGIGCRLIERQHSSDGRHEMRAITWEPPEDVELQFWSHPDSATAGAFTVKDFEDGLAAAHASCVTSYHCGFDQWLDNHYAYDGEASLDHYVELLADANATYSLWEQAFQTLGDEITLYTLYFADSTGHGVQLDGTLTHAPAFIPQWSEELCGDGKHCKVH